VRLESLSHPIDRRKGRSPVPAEIPPDISTSQRCGLLPPDDRAQRLAQVRAVPADAAPAFRARAALAESEGRP
jgi:hypothetical protein